MANLFQTVSSIVPGKSAFNLSYQKMMTLDMGQLIPAQCDECIPGDRWTIGNEIVIRMNPMVAPIMHEINCFVHYFFVPYRLLWDSWETFITGGVDGDDASVLPRWEPTDTAVGSLWDYFGFPTGVDPDGAYPIDFPKRAYNLVWNEYYRDETLQAEVDITSSEDILLRNWSKDYFTSALEGQQRGPAVAMPISGTSSAVFDSTVLANVKIEVGPADFRTLLATDVGAGVQQMYLATNPGNVGAAVYAICEKIDLDKNEVDLSSATTFDIADLRLAVQTQLWQERNNRAGVRYTEFLQSHFAVSPRDDRLQRPEYIGGSKTPIIVSEVLQTSETDTTPQGTLAGHGISVNSQFCGKFRVEEFGLIIGIMSIMPVPAYQQGINRQWLRRSRFDFPFPEFVNLSEQGIEMAELYATDDALENTTLFGYQGRYDELRYKPNMVCGLMRTDFAHWHLGRIFSAPGPALNSDFIECVPDKRIFAVPSEPGFIATVGNIIKAIRPIPIQAEPGLMDHV